MKNGEVNDIIIVNVSHELMKAFLWHYRGIISHNDESKLREHFRCFTALKKAKTGLLMTFYSQTEKLSASVRSDDRRCLTPCSALVHASERVLL